MVKVDGIVFWALESDYDLETKIREKDVPSGKKI